MQVHPAALPLDFVDLAFAVLLAASLERQQLRVPGQLLQMGQQVSDRHSLSVSQHGVGPMALLVAFQQNYVAASLLEQASAPSVSPAQGRASHLGGLQPRTPWSGPRSPYRAHMTKAQV
jgi:hypothetical protein